MTEPTILDRIAALLAVGGEHRYGLHDITQLEHALQTALLAEGDQTRELPAASLALGAIIMVRPGDRIPADGDIVEGQSAIDESPVTRACPRANKWATRCSPAPSTPTPFSKSG